MSDALNDQKEFDKMQWRRETHPEHFNNLHDDNKYRVPKTGTYMIGNQKIEVTDGVCVAVKGIEPVGIKQDFGKPKISLIPSEAIIEMAKAFTYGASKYSEHNFKLGIKYSRLLDAAMRHLLAFNSGEDIDFESKNNHLGHALASIAMLTYMTYNKKDMDDRYKQPEIK
jgi:hypothetical protein